MFPEDITNKNLGTRLINLPVLTYIVTLVACDGADEETSKYFINIHRSAIRHTTKYCRQTRMNYIIPLDVSVLGLGSVLIRARCPD